MQSLNTITVTVNDIPLELYDAKAESKSLLDILQAGEVKQIHINPVKFTEVKYEKGLSSNPNVVVSSGKKKEVGIIGLLKSWDITWDNKRVLMGFHAGWHPNNLPKFRRRQFNHVDVQTFYGNSQNDRTDWLILQLHPKNKHDIIATRNLLVRKGIELTRKNMIENMVLRNDWDFEFKDPDLAGQDNYAIWENEQKVNKKIEQVQEGHLQILMSESYRGYKFLNQPTLSKSVPGSRAYLVNQTRTIGGYTRLKKVFADLDQAIEVDQFVQAIKGGKVKVTEFEVIKSENGKVFVKFEQPIPAIENEEEKAIWIKTRMDQTDGYKELATYLDELSKASKVGAKSAKLV